METTHVAVVIRTELRRNGVIFRANASYRGHVWRDWVIVDWGEEEGKLPAKIWGFVDLSAVPEDNGLNCGDCDILPATHAIVESATFNDKESVAQSEMFVPLVKEVGGFTRGNVSHLKFYLVDVEAFVKPVCVVPDIGGAPNAYFLLKDRAEWKTDFEEWLECDYEEISMSEGRYTQVGQREDDASDNFEHLNGQHQENDGESVSSLEEEEIVTQ